MWKRILTLFWGNNKKTLGDILAVPDNRDILLGIKRIIPPSNEKILADIDHAIRYSTTEDYEIWSKEVWSNVLINLDKLLVDDISPQEIDFHRGSIHQALEILRISHKARLNRDDVSRRTNFKPHVNGNSAPSGR